MPRSNEPAPPVTSPPFGGQPFGGEAPPPGETFTGEPLAALPGGGPSVRGRPGRGRPAATHTHHEYEAEARSRAARAGIAAATGSQAILAALGYLGVIFFAFLPALVIYIAKGRSAPYLRYHSAQAVNVSITVLLFDLCALIVGGMLALDAVAVSLSIVVPLVTLLWLVVLVYIVRMAFATARGEVYELPRWLCIDLLH
ncbi:MAG TPA: DUF4870 domain-containing protein [Streptosporangiaceae bacterium]|nr:DUF4870 domain-containing protein [Streptosporangiaceae bacterium]